MDQQYIISIFQEILVYCDTILFHSLADYYNLQQHVNATCF